MEIDTDRDMKIQTVKKKVYLFRQVNTERGTQVEKAIVLHRRKYMFRWRNAEIQLQMWQKAGEKTHRQVDTDIGTDVDRHRHKDVETHTHL